MKQVLIFLSTVVLVSFSLISCGNTARSASTMPEVINRAIDTGSWVFTVTNIRPQGGASRLPNGFYMVSFSPGNLNVHLPYFGRAFGTADLFSGENVLNFISKDFEMKKQLMKQDKWQISFVPKDRQQEQKFVFVIFGNGHATLDVTMNNRSPISYSGDVTRWEK